MPDTDNFVYINAPTLDNADECKFVRNNDFLYATAGDDVRGATANLVLYEKLINNECYFSVDESDLFRTEYKLGEWVDQDVYNGGDYHKNGPAGVKSDIFKTGKLNSLGFRFFTEESYNTDNPTLIIPTLGNYTPPSGATEKEIRAAKLEILNNYIPADSTTPVNPDLQGNPIFPTKIAFFIQNGGGWNFTSYGTLDPESLPVDNDGWFNFTLDEDVYVTAEHQDRVDKKYYFFFIPNSQKDNTNLNFNKTTIYEEGNLRELSYNQNCGVCMRSTPRGSLDPTSYICKNVSYGNGTAAGESRLIEFKYCSSTDLVNEYLTDNSDKHHLDIKEAQDINSLRYFAPLNIVKSSGKKIIITASQVHISDNSLRKNGIIDINGERITSIRIPMAFLPEDNEKYAYIDGSHRGAHANVCNFPIYLEFSFDQTNWIQSDNVVTYSYYDMPGIYEWKFERKEIENDVIYNSANNNGDGIYIRAKKRDGGNLVQFPIYVYRNTDGTYYSYSTEDVVHWSTETASATAFVKILFSYRSRMDWFDYIESIQREGGVSDDIIEINNSITNIENNITDIENNITDVGNNIENIYNSLYETNLTYINNHDNGNNIDTSDRLTISWFEIGECHTQQMDGILQSFTLYFSNKTTSDTDFDIYSSPKYLCLMEEDKDGNFVHKATSTNALSPSQGGFGTWFFHDVCLTKKKIRVGLVSSTDEILKNLGETQTNTILYTAILNDSVEKHDGCYGCSPEGVKDGGADNVPEVPWTYLIYKNKVSLPSQEFYDHIENTNIHVTIEDKERWDKNTEDIYNIKYSETHIHNNITNYTDVKIKWVEFDEAAVEPAIGEVAAIKIDMASGEWPTPDNGEEYYLVPVYLKIMEANDNGTFINKATSINGIIPRCGLQHEWKFKNLELTGNRIRVGYVWYEGDNLPELGADEETLNFAPTMYIKGATKPSDSCGCYVCNESGVAQRDYTCPMIFVTPGGLANNEEIININNNITNINNKIDNYFTSESTLKLGKWRIYVNDEGSLVIDTETLFNAGKSIVFKDLE